METLAERIARDGPLSTEDAVGWAVRLAKHLESLHVHGVAHGSVSPASVASEASQATSAGVVLDVRKVSANVAFHSPERVRSGQISPQDDAWALAATLYAVLTGVSPFQGVNEPEVRDRILAGQPAPLAVYGVDDENLQKIVAGGLAGELAHRYGSLAQMRADLERWLPSAALLEPLDDEADGDEDQAATTMLPMQDAMRAISMATAGRSASPATPSTPRPAAGAPSATRPAAPPAALPVAPIATPPLGLAPPRPLAPPVIPAPQAVPAGAAPVQQAPAPRAGIPEIPRMDDPTGDGMFEEPSFEDEGGRQEQDETVMRELPAHIMALAARSAAGSTPPPPKPDAPHPPVNMPRPPLAPPAAGMGPAAGMALPPGGMSPPMAGGMALHPPASRPDPARARQLTPAGQPPADDPDHDPDDVRTVFAHNAVPEAAQRPRGLPAPPPPRAPVALPAPDDDDDDDDGVRTVIRDPGAPDGPPRPPPPGPPPPPGGAPQSGGVGRPFKSTQLGVGGFQNAAPPAATSGSGAGSGAPLAGPGHAQGGPGWPPASPGGPPPTGVQAMGGPGVAPAFADSPLAQPTPQSGVRFGSNAPGGDAPPGAGGLADVGALIQDALGSPGGGAMGGAGAAGGPGGMNMGGTGAMAPGGLGGFGMGGPGYGPPAQQPQGQNPHGQGPQGQHGPMGDPFGPTGAQGPHGPGSGAGGPGSMGGPFGMGGPGSAGGMGGGYDAMGNMGGPGTFPTPMPGGGPPGAFPMGMSPGAGAPPIPPHLLNSPGQPMADARGSMRTWYVVCALAMILVAAVTFIALRYMSG